MAEWTGGLPDVGLGLKTSPNPTLSPGSALEISQPLVLLGSS